MLLLQDDRKVDKYVISELEAQLLKEKKARCDVEQLLVEEQRARSAMTVSLFP